MVHTGGGTHRTLGGVRDNNSLQPRWNQAAKNWRSMDLSSGWDVGFRATQLLLYGKLKLAQQSGRRGACGALPYLVRSLVGMVGLKQQQPEGIRDLLNAIAEALERSNDPCHKEVKRVAKMCVDFSSWFHPARALTRA